jgi:hypothetical protein
MTASALSTTLTILPLLSVLDPLALLFQESDPLRAANPAMYFDSKEVIRSFLKSFSRKDENLLLSLCQPRPCCWNDPLHAPNPAIFVCAIKREYREGFLTSFSLKDENVTRWVVGRRHNESSEECVWPNLLYPVGEEDIPWKN